MKASILVTLACVATTTLAAAPVRKVRDLAVGPNECGFYAAVEFTPSGGPLQHCWLESVLVPAKGAISPPCAVFASTLESGRGGKATSCNFFPGRRCTKSKEGAQGEFCSGSNQWPSLANKNMITGALRNCLDEVKPPGTDPKTWTRTGCAVGKVPAYDMFKSR